MTMKAVRGSCFCGEVRFEVAAPESFACFCYCHSCQRAAGAPVVAWATYSHDSFKTTRGKVHKYHSSPGVTRGVCNKCGSTISYENEKRPGDIDISINCLDEPAAATPRAHIWTEDKQPWFEIGDDLPVYEQNAG